MLHGGLPPVLPKDMVWKNKMNSLAWFARCGPSYQAWKLQSQEKTKERNLVPHLTTDIRLRWTGLDSRWVANWEYPKYFTTMNWSSLVKLSWIGEISEYPLTYINMWISLLLCMSCSFREEASIMPSQQQLLWSEF